MKNKWLAIVLIALVGVVAMMGCNNGSTKDKNSGNLTINGLPGSINFGVFVYPSGTDLSTYTAIGAAGMSFISSGGTDSYNQPIHLYYKEDGLTRFNDSGNLPVLLRNSDGSNTDVSNPMYRTATVSFTN